MAFDTESFKYKLRRLGKAVNWLCAAVFLSDTPVKFFVIDKIRIDVYNIHTLTNYRFTIVKRRPQRNF